MKYSYDGPVTVYDVCVINRWKASTYAPSESRAKSNLLYQYKKENKKLPTARVELPGKINKVV